MSIDPATNLRAATRVIAYLLTISVFVLFSSGRTTPFALIALTVAVTSIALREQKISFDPSILSASFLSLIALSTYMALSATWAPDPLDTLAKGLAAASTVIAAFVVSRWFTSQLDERAGALAVVFVAAYVCCAGLLMIDLATDLEIRRQILNGLGIRPSHAYYRIGQDGTIERISPNALAHSITVLMLLLWPALMCCSGALRGRQRQIVFYLTLVMVGAAVFLSRSDSSKLAFLGGVMAFALLSWRSLLVVRAIALAWSIAVLAMLPLALVAFEHRLYHAEWIPKSAQDRIVIWGHTAQETLKSPLLGSGANAAYTLNKAEKATAKPPPGGHRQVMTVSTHAHNVYLQAWYELGFVGVMLFLASGLLLLREIGHMEHRSRMFSASTFVAFMILSFSTWGAFQYWFMAAFALTAGFLAVGRRALTLPEATDWPQFVWRWTRDDYVALLRLRRRSAK